MKLIDDLLDDENESTSAGQKQVSLSAIDIGGDEPTGVSNIVQGEESKTNAIKDGTQPLDLELSDMVKLPEEPKSTAPSAAPEKIKDEATVRLSESVIRAPIKGNDRLASPQPQPQPQHEVETKAAVGRYSPLRSGGFSSATEASLATSENLRIAQTRILELEQELSRLRTNNEQLAAAGETLRRRADELLAQTSALQERLVRNTENKDQEIEILRQSQLQKDKEVGALRLKIEELEMRLSTNIQKIRVRERELENRLELGKMESSALVRSKDEIILDLKRQLDQLNLELENYRNKGHELNKQINDKQEMLRRTVKALRLALSMLEGDDDGAQKKVK